MSASEKPTEKPNAPKPNAPAAEQEHEPHIRVAGRKEMALRPKRWDEVDEEGDEPFPASDPPGNY